MRHAVFALAFLLASATSAESLADEIFRWVDESGEVHYTNDSEAIPSRYRKKAKRTSGADLGEVSGGSRPQAVREEAPAQHPDEQAEDEQRWRDAFREAHERVRALEASLEADRRRLDEPAGMTVQVGADGMVRPNAEYEALRERVRATELELARAREALHDLDVQASRKAVPREWRR